MVALPTFSADSFPSDTVTTELSLLFQLIFLLVALSGLIVAVSVILSPSVSSTEVGLRLTPATDITSGSGIGPSHDVENCKNVINISDAKKH